MPDASTASSYDDSDLGPDDPVLRLGFARGVAPSKWLQRWEQARSGPGYPRLEAAPLGVNGRPAHGQEFDVLLERVAPGRRPVGAVERSGTRLDGAVEPGTVELGTVERGRSGRAGTESAAGAVDASGLAGAGSAGNSRSAVTSVSADSGAGSADMLAVHVGSASDVGTTAVGEPPTAARFAVRLYAETIALVVAADHELAEQASIDLPTLEFVTLLSHPDHAAGWPAPEPWADPTWAPRNVTAALEIVATGAGAILLPLPFARHVTRKRTHAVLPIVDPQDPQRSPLPGTEIWASWAVERDGADVQQLIGVLRGRTARSGRPGAESRGSGVTGKPKVQPTPAKKKAKALPKNSRGAQLAAAKAKQDAQRAAKRAERAKKRR